MRTRLSLVRFLLEAAFLILAAAAAGLAGLDTLWIGVVMLGAWILVALVERLRSRRSRRSAEPVAEAGAPEPEPEPEREAEPEPEPSPERAPVLVAVPPRREPEPEPEPEPAPTVVPLALRDRTPRAWNLWELERLAGALGDSGAEERTLLLHHMREFADAAGNLPAEFDPLVRDAFGNGLAELVT